MAYESVKPGQGIVIDAWEVAALAKLFGDGMQTRLTDFSNAFANTIPSLKKAPVADLFLKGLRGAAQGDQPAMRFWADFITELGRQSAQPYDLLAPDVDTTKIDLDAIQVSLILRRFVADLMILQASKSHKAQFALAWEPGLTSLGWKLASYKFQGGAIRDAVWPPRHRPRLLRVEGGGGSGLPCTLKELEAQILDTTAYSALKAFDSMLEYMSEHEWEGAEKYSTTTAIINSILALIKLYVYYACMETDITMSGEPPLVRTQNIYQPGEKRTLTATVRENIGKWQAVNCVRIALNGANLDISLPNDGPVAGVKTQWILTSGAMGISHGSVSEGFVELVSSDGTPHVKDAMGDISNPSAPKTDEEGHTTIDIEGMKQKEKLSSPIPLMKQAEVRFTTAAKPVTMSQDLIDAVGNGLGGPIGMGVAGPVEMLLRSDIHMSKKLLIPVKDWDSSDGGWGGTISYTSTWHFEDRYADNNHKSNSIKDQTIHDEIRLRGNPNSGSGLKGSSHGNFTASYDQKFKDVTTWPPASRPGMSFGGATITTEENTAAAGGGEVTVDIAPREGNKYEIGTTSFTIPGVDLWHTTCSGDCKGKDSPDRSSSISWGETEPAVTAQEDPNQPGILRGTSTFNDVPMKGATTTVNWNLTQCQDRR